MGKLATPLDLWALGLKTGVMVAEAQSVMAMRMMGMAGLWNVTPNENRAMVAEKSKAFTDATLAATFASIRGKRPDEIATAALKPIGQKTRSNHRRLSKRGLKRK